jgi:hypothetical protein
LQQTRVGSTNRINEKDRKKLSNSNSTKRKHISKSITGEEDNHTTVAMKTPQEFNLLNTSPSVARAPPSLPHTPLSRMGKKYNGYSAYKESNSRASGSVSLHKPAPSISLQSARLCFSPVKADTCKTSPKKTIFSAVTHDLSSQCQRAITGVVSLPLGSEGNQKEKAPKKTATKVCN